MSFPRLALRSAVVVWICAAWPSTAAAVPAQLTTQGRILDADALPMVDTHGVSFRLMDSETGGDTLWEETQSVSFTNGFYTVMLGADEEGNPLEDSVLDQWPLYLEVQLEGAPAMVPRMAVGSVPFARQAGMAAELAPGASIDAGSISVDGTEVVAADGTWAGATPDVDWSDLTGIPPGFADASDADTLDTLVCSDGQWAVWDTAAAAWTCDGFSDTTLSDPDVVRAVGTAAVDLYTGSTMDGYTLLHTESNLDWDHLVGVPSGLDDGDDDTLGDLSCGDDESPVYNTSGGWACQPAASSSGTSTSLYRMAAGCVAGMSSSTQVRASSTLLTLSATCRTLECYNGYNACAGGCTAWASSPVTCSNTLVGTILLQ